MARTSNPPHSNSAFPCAVAPLPGIALSGIALSGIVLLGLLALSGCEATVGPCTGEGCPRLPGCEGDNPVTCDPDHVCVEQVCEGVGWICGVDQKGNYSWLNKSAPCDDQDSCTHKDLCVDGACRGTRVPCDNPPPNVCKDDQTLQAWESNGYCAEGTCIYKSTNLACPKGCANGVCVGAPCTGVKCDKPPGPCYKKPGKCVAGKCQWEPLAAGAACDPGDKCISGATCDGQGKCSGGAVNCTRPHASGGTCVLGACQGYTCDSGWGNCDNSWSNGCATPLNTGGNCGGCGKACGVVSNGSPECENGTCVAKCNSPWADCDKTYKNGCERQVGVANVCNVNGMASWSGSTPPCGTAYCGSSSNSRAKNFGSWYCISCSHCQKKPDGYFAWCLGGTKKFSPSKCLAPSCGCNPNSSSYPQLCKK